MKIQAFMKMTFVRFGFTAIGLLVGECAWVFYLFFGTADSP